MAKKRKKGFFVSLLVLLILGVLTFFAYKKFFPRVQLRDKNYAYVYVERQDNFDDVVEKLSSEGIIVDPDAFEWLGKKMGLDKNVHPGKFRINNGMTLRQIVNLLKYNKQEKVRLTFNSQIRNLDEFVDYVDDKLELDGDDIESYLVDEKKLKSDFQLEPDNSFALVIPGTYEVGWAINVEEFFSILKEKYNRIWNANRTAKAKKLGFSVPEVITIASIVQSESSIPSEQEKIAGVYINRLNKGMYLQADPTLKFANKNYDANRVLDADKEINSPYNTYRYKGLPPGPICLVGTQAIDATLNYKKHNFIFFCAKPQLNGFSDYSIDYNQHKKFANAYQRSLDKKGINR